MSARRLASIGAVASLILLAFASAPQPLIAPKASAAIETVYDQFLGPSPGDSDNAYSNHQIAQSFVASATYKVTRIELLVRDVGTDNRVNITLADNNDLDNTPGLPRTYSSADGPDGWAWVSFVMPPSPASQLTAGEVYWIVLQDNTVQNSNAYSWEKRTIPQLYPSGDAASCSGSNCKWSVDPNADYLFKVYGIFGPSIDGWCEVDSMFAGSTDPLQYTVHFDNTGTQFAPNLWINMTLSPDVDLIYASDNSWMYNGTHSSPNWLFRNVVVGLHSFLVNVTVGPNVRDGTILRANFTFQYSDSDGNIQEDRSCSATTLARVPSLSLYKEVFPDYATKGDSLNFTITFTNSGSRLAALVWVNDTLPGSVIYSFDTSQNGTGPGNTSSLFLSRLQFGNTLIYTFGNVTPGTYRFAVNVTINTAVLNGTEITNIVSLNYTDSSGKVRGPIFASATARVEGASIRVKAETLDNPVARNDTLRFVVTFNNEGTAAAAFVWVNDTLPSGTTYVTDNAEGTILGYNRTLSTRGSGYLRYVFTNIPKNDPAMDPRFFVISVMVGSTVNDGQVLTNHVDVDHTDWDHTLLDSSSAESSAVVMMPNIDFQSSAPGTANPGDFVTYNMVMSNIGTGVAQQVWLNVRESQELTYYFDNSSEYVYLYQAQRRGPQTWLFKNVGSGSIFLAFTYKLRVGLQDRTPVVTCFEVNYTDYKGRPMGSIQQCGTTAVITPIMTLEIVQNKTEASRESEIVYTIHYNNTGTGTAANVWINDTIPDSTAMWRSSRQFVYSSGGKFTWHFTGLAPGAHNMTVTIRVDSQATIGANLLNGADMIYEDANGNYIDRLQTSVSAKVVDGEPPVGPPSVQTNLPLWILVAILLATLTVMWLFVGRKFYGLGIKNKARIDELFLLHRSGELIRHHSRSLRPEVDSDVLSAMLVAVQNFVKESFNFRAGDLEELKFGDEKIVLIHGEHVIVAAVVQGPFPQRLEPVLRNALEEIEARFGETLDEWSGLTEDLPKIDDILSQVFEDKASGWSGRID